MTKFPFVAGSYRSRSTNFDAQRTINLYPEVSGSGTSKSIAMLIGTPGKRVWQKFGASPIRGMLRFTQALAVIAAGDRIYTVTADGLQTFCGNITYRTTPVSMASNGKVVMIVTGDAGYVLDPISTTLTEIVDSDFTKDPGYQFRMDEGQGALEASAGCRTRWVSLV